MCGAEADLAQAFVRAMEDYPYSLIVPASDAFDWRDAAAVSSLFNEKSPSVVVQFPERSRRCSEQDVARAEVLAQQCQTKSIPLLVCSSFVLFGEAYRQGSALESASPEQDHDNAKRFHSYEQAALKLDHSLVLRLPWILDVVADCLLNHIAAPLLGGQLGAASDHHKLGLVSTDFVVRSLTAMLQQIFCGAENWGVFHLHSADTCTEAEFVDATVRSINAETALELPMPEVIAGRGGGRLLRGNAHLIGARCTDNFGIQLPTWRVGFKTIVRRWLHGRGLLPDLRRVAR